MLKLNHLSLTWVTSVHWKICLHYIPGAGITQACLQNTLWVIYLQMVSSQHNYSKLILSVSCDENYWYFMHSVFETVGLNRLFKFLFILIFLSCEGHKNETHFYSAERNMKKKIIRVRARLLSIYLSVCLSISLSNLFISLSFILWTSFEHVNFYPGLQQYFENNCVLSHILPQIFLVFVPIVRCPWSHRSFSWGGTSRGVSAPRSSFSCDSHEDLLGGGRLQAGGSPELALEKRRGCSRKEAPAFDKVLGSPFSFLGVEPHAGG